MTKTALVADDHELYRLALGNILRDSLGFQTVETVDSYEAAIAAIERAPDLGMILLDLTMPGMDGAASLAAVRTMRPNARLAVVSGSQDRGDMLGALTSGVHGYVPKSHSIDEMTEALRRIADGQVYLPPSFAAVPDGTAPAAVPSPRPATPRPVPARPARARRPAAVAAESLTVRQRQVLEQIRRGCTNREIAENLALAPGTVKTHMAGLFKTLGVRNRSEAAVAAMEMLAS